MKRFIDELLDALPLLLIAAWFLFAVFSLSGCSTVRPDYGTVALVHTSQPFKGPGPAPFGDNERSQETTMDGVQLGAEWERGSLFWDATVLYALRNRNVAGGPWVTTFRIGARIKVPR